MKLTDVLASVLLEHGMRHAFGLQGGAVVHIFDSLQRAGIDVTYMHHEQSAALAAVANARISGRPGCCVVTTGPGSTNAITGLLAAWQDSIPCLFLSGQARSQHTSYGRKVRQVGTQEVNIRDIVRPITKASMFITDKDSFAEQLRHALEIACGGRPGPVWIDLPLDFQWADIPFEARPVAAAAPGHDRPALDLAAARASAALLSEAKRPLLVLGHGIRSAGASAQLETLIKRHELPFVTTWTAADLFPTDDPLNLGIIGISGQRGANRAAFNADLLLCLGTHLSIPHTSTQYESYAPDARKIIVNIDADQLDNLNVAFDLKLHADLSDYLDWLCGQDLGSRAWPDSAEFKQQNWYEPKHGERPNSNTYFHTLTGRAADNTCLVIDGGGTALYAGFQSAVIKRNGRIICSSAISAMGTGLAETVGAALGREFSRMLCIVGDGSLLMNVQDLQTLRQNNVNVIISVINNNGYLAIRQTQNEFLEGRRFGTHPDWGLTLPSIEKLAAAFEIPYVRLDRAAALDTTVDQLLAMRGPVICEVVVDEDQDVLFKQGFKANANGTFSPQPLSDMHPFI